MSKVKTIKVSNLKAVSELHADFNGCTAIITGGNNKGKSTFLRSLPDRLRGIKPDVILRHEQSEGYAEWELTTGEKFIWSFDNKTKAGERLSFITKDAAGNEIKTSITKEIVNRYFPDIFDVDSFLNSSPAKQNKILQEISGLDFTALDARHKTAYEDRTFANRKRDDAAVLVGIINPNLPSEEIDVLELQKKVASIDLVNQRYKTVEDGITSKLKSIEKNESEIKRLEKMIKELEKANKAFNTDIKNGKKWLSDAKNAKVTDEESFKLNKELQEADDTNKAIRENNKKIEAKKRHEQLVKEADDADKKVKDIAAERENLVKNAKLPEGFGFTDDGITYNGLPFTKEQLSSSGIYIAALKLASMTIGEVKTLHFDASYLDKHSLEDIEKWAHDNDLQLLIERPDYEGGEIEYRLIQQ